MQRGTGGRYVDIPGYCTEPIDSFISSSNTSKTASKSIHIGDAILPESATKLTKTYGSEFGTLLWRHLTLQRKTAIWMHNYSPSGAQQQVI